MEKLSIYLITALLLILCFSCDDDTQKNHNDLTQMGLKGKVKSLKIEKFQPVYRFGKLEKVPYEKGSKKNLIEYYHFNKDGMITDAFKQDYGSDYTKTHYTYDQFSNLSGKSILDYKMTEHYKYDPYEHKQRIVDSTFKYKYVSYIYDNTYDEKNNLVEINEYSQDSLLSKTVIDYKENSKERKRSVKYNGVGRKLENIDYSFEISDLFTMFEKNSNIKTKEKYIVKHDDGHKYLYLYKFDKNKNWIEELICHNTEKDPEELTIRDIVYYDEEILKNSKEKEQVTSSDESILYPPNWNIVNIESIGSIAIPPFLEVRNNNSKTSKIIDKKMNDLMDAKDLDISKPTIIIQPKGINDHFEDINEDYTRIIVNVQKGKRGDFPTNDYEFSKSELSEIDNIRKEQVKDLMIKFNSDLIEWKSCELKKVNNINIIKCGYWRGNVKRSKWIIDLSGFEQEKRTYSSLVIVSDYTIFNDNYMINITMSYRIGGCNLDEDDFYKIKDEFNYYNRNRKKVDLDFIINTLNIKIK